MHHAMAKSAGAGVSLVSPGFVSRDQKGVAPEILAAAFSAPQPAVGARAYAGVDLGTDRAVLMVSAVKPGDSAGLSDQQRLSNMNALSRQDGSQEFAAYLAFLKQKAKVEVNSKNLDQSDQ